MFYLVVRLVNWKLFQTRDLFHTMVCQTMMFDCNFFQNKARNKSYDIFFLFSKYRSRIIFARIFFYLRRSITLWYHKKKKLHEMFFSSYFRKKKILAAWRIHTNRPRLGLLSAKILSQKNVRSREPQNKMLYARKFLIPTDAAKRTR